MSELFCPGCGYRGEMETAMLYAKGYSGHRSECPCCHGKFPTGDCTEEGYEAVTAELERRTLHTRRLERVASPAPPVLVIDGMVFDIYDPPQFVIRDVPEWTKAINLNDTPFPEGYAFLAEDDDD